MLADPIFACFSRRVRCRLADISIVSFSFPPCPFSIELGAASFVKFGYPRPARLLVDGPPCCIVQTSPVKRSLSIHPAWAQASYDRCPPPPGCRWLCSLRGWDWKQLHSFISNVKQAHGLGHALAGFSPRMSVWTSFKPHPAHCSVVRTPSTALQFLPCNCNLRSITPHSQVVSESSYLVACDGRFDLAGTRGAWRLVLSPTRSARRHRHEDSSQHLWQRPPVQQPSPVQAFRQELRSISAQHCNLLVTAEA